MRPLVALRNTGTRNVKRLGLWNFLYRMILLAKSNTAIGAFILSAAKELNH
jgi:hypothetical protein